uniref:Uncharacterized protein n=1 Tax=Arundo donax TaxID=35708 RepID=A0A0A9CP65_ARUDO
MQGMCYGNKTRRTFHFGRGKNHEKLCVILLNHMEHPFPCTVGSDCYPEHFIIQSLIPKLKPVLRGNSGSVFPRILCGWLMVECFHRSCASCGNTNKVNAISQDLFVGGSLLS